MAIADALYGLVGIPCRMFASMNEGMYFDDFIKDNFNCLRDIETYPYKIQYIIFHIDRFPKFTLKCYNSTNSHA